MHIDAYWCILAYSNVIKITFLIISCTKYLQNTFRKHFDTFWANLIISDKKIGLSTFCSKCSEWENMRQNASKCTQNELCKCFMHKIFKEVVFILQNRLKLTIFLAKIAHFVLSNQNTSICIRIHQNVCRMNCANVLCTKLPKKWILLHFNRLKLKNYLYLFVMEDPVCNIVIW